MPTYDLPNVIGELSPINTLREAMEIDFPTAVHCAFSHRLPADTMAVAAGVRPISSKTHTP